MESAEREQLILRLTAELVDCEARFDAEARKRGFDPAQAENMALPSRLATLFTECQGIRDELAEIGENQEGD